jgi:ferredoxin
MPEGTLCNRQPVNTVEQLQALLADKSGKQYYEEMRHLDVDQAALWATLQKSLKSRLRTWLSICAHCGMCADSCFFYLTNDRDPKQVPSYKIQSTLGEMVRRKGKVDNDFMHYCMDTAWSKCTCCNRCALYCPFGIDTGVMFSYLRGVIFSRDCALGDEDRFGHAPHLPAQMDVTSEDWVETCEWMCEEYQEDWPGLEFPVDKPNADIMYTVNAREVQALPRRSGRSGHPLPYGRRELDRAQPGLGGDQPGHVRRRLGRLQDAGRERLRRHGAAQAQAHGGHRVRPRLPRHGDRGPLLGGTQDRQDAGRIDSLCRMGGRGPAHRQAQDRSGQEDQGAGHLPGFVQLHPQRRFAGAAAARS